MAAKVGYKWILMIGIAFIAFFILFALPLIIKAYVFQAYKIPAASMEPTLLVGDHILVNKNSKIRDEVKQKDIIVFKFPVDPSKDFIKRVVGMPCDTLEIKNREIFINGQRITEDYAVRTDSNNFISHENKRDNLGPIEIPSNKFFVMGDNRDHSYDSRYWGFVDRDKIKGKATIIYWSWDKENNRVRWDRIGMKVR